jgi:hypothetical protein
MLPITSRRVIHVPHSLATLAAILALVTAMGWDFASSDIDRTAASPAPAGTLEQASEPVAKTGDRTDRSDPGTGQRSVSGLLPLVLPSLSGR